MHEIIIRAVAHVVFLPYTFIFYEVDFTNMGSNVGWKAERGEEGRISSCKDWAMAGWEEAKYRDWSGFANRKKAYLSQILPGRFSRICESLKRRIRKQEESVSFTDPAREIQ
jgi:hypothetical protein